MERETPEGRARFYFIDRLRFIPDSHYI